MMRRSGIQGLVCVCLMLGISSGWAGTNDVIMGKMTPAEFKLRLTNFPCAYVPIGQLEWHNEHLPLGTDSVKAEQLCVLAARQGGGIVIPADFFGIAPLEEWTNSYGFTNSWGPDENGSIAGPGGFAVEPSLVTNMYVEQILNLDRMGFKACIMFSGHYPPHQPGLLAWMATYVKPPNGMKLSMMTDRDLANGPPANAYGDHAGINETSIMWALFPDQIQMDKIPPGPLFNTYEDPRNGAASYSKGQGIVSQAVGEMVTNAQALVASY